MDSQMIFFLLRHGFLVHICNAKDREEAKRTAHHHLGGNVEDYTVTPLTVIGDNVQINISN